MRWAWCGREVATLVLVALVPVAALAHPAGPTGPLRVVVDKQHNEFTFPMASEPTEVILDPDSWVTMMHATFGHLGHRRPRPCAHVLWALGFVLGLGLGLGLWALGLGLGLGPWAFGLST